MTPQLRDLVSSILVLLAAFSSGTAYAGTCEGLDPEGRKALQYLIDDASGKGTAGREDFEGVRWATTILLSRGQKVLPCLLEIYRQGRTTGDSLRIGAHSQKSGKWTITLIRQIDPKTAVPLYRELRSEAEDPLTRVQLAAELAILGDSQFLQEIVDFLDHPPDLSSERKGDVTYVQERALMAISVQDHRAALPVLKKLEGSFPYKPLIDVYIAQLSGDISAIEKYIEDPRATSPALLVLKRMGKLEILGRIANDPANPARKAAQAVLTGAVGP